jgi:anti-sigma factor RsiW
MTQIPFERLMAYADGELDEEEARAIERRVARDPGLAEQLAALRGQDSLLRSAQRCRRRCRRW